MMMMASHPHYHLGVHLISSCVRFAMRLIILNNLEQQQQNRIPRPLVPNSLVVSWMNVASCVREHTFYTFLDKTRYYNTRWINFLPPTCLVVDSVLLLAGSVTRDNTSSGAKEWGRPERMKAHSARCLLCCTWTEVERNKVAILCPFEGDKFYWWAPGPTGHGNN